MGEARVALDVIAAADARLGIGRAGVLPWSAPSEFAYFLRMVGGGGGGAVAVGRRTWDTMGAVAGRRPLPGGALHLVLSRRARPPSPASLADGARFCASLPDAARAAAQHGATQMWVIGGTQVYREALRSPLLRRVFLSRIEGAFDCDAFFPEEILDAKRFRRLPPEEVRDDRVPSGPQRDQASGLTFEVCVYEPIASTSTS